MTALDTPATPVDDPLRRPGPAHPRRCLTTMPCDRVVRQVRGIDTWNAAMRLREALLCGSGGSRNGGMDGARRLEVLRLTHAAVVESTARELARLPAPMLGSVPTAVVAHQHAWFRGRVSALLAEHGFVVVEQTGNGAEALGAIIAEQPDLVLAGDRLAMMTGAELLSETALFSPRSVRLAQGDEAGRLVAASGNVGALS